MHFNIGQSFRVSNLQMVFINSGKFSVSCLVFLILLPTGLHPRKYSRTSLSRTPLGLTTVVLNWEVSWLQRLKWIEITNLRLKVDVLNRLRTDGRDTEIAQNLRLSKHSDMTIHWRALEEHFLMVPLVFRFNHFWREKALSEFFSEKPQSLNCW
jgi:hypothetical protein